MTRLVSCFITLALVFFINAAQADVVHEVDDSPTLAERFKHLQGITDRPLKVVATIKPVHSLVSNVVADLKLPAPRLLMESSIDPHHFSLKPSQAKILEEADIVFMANPEVEVFLAERAAKQPNKYYSLFNSHVKYANGSHGWLSPYHAMMSVVPIYQILASDFDAVSYPKKEGFFAHKKLDSMRERYLKDKKINSGKSIAADSHYFNLFNDFYGIESLVLPHNSLPAKRPNCIVLTHGANRRIELLAKAKKIKLIKADILGSQYPANSEQYPMLMNGLVQQISDCLE